MSLSVKQKEEKVYQREKNLVSLKMFVTLDYFERKVKYPGKRSEMTKQLSRVIDSKMIEPEDALKGLEILTRAFIYDKPRQGEENYFDQQHAERLSYTLIGIDDLEKPTDIANDETLYTRNYFSRVEMLINEIDLTFPADQKKEKLGAFAKCFREMANGPCGFLRGVVPYQGETMRISADVLDHRHSVLILPDDPSEAVAALYGDSPRLLFEEFGGDKSAEAIVKMKYRHDDTYKNHYKTFLYCKNRYTNQMPML